MVRRLVLSLVVTISVGLHCTAELRAQPPPDRRERTFKSGDCTFSLPGVLRVREFVPGQEDMVYAVVMLYLTTPQEVLEFGEPKGIEAIGSDNSPLTRIDRRIQGDLDFPDTPAVGRAGERQWLRQITVKWPDGGTDEIKLLQGVLPITVPKGKAEIRFDNPLEAKEKTIEREGIKITMKSITYAEQHLEVRLAGEGEIKYPNVIIITPDGNETRFRSSSSKWTNVDGKDIFEFTGSGEGVKVPPRAIVLRFSTAREVIEVPFEFHGIPLL